LIASEPPDILRIHAKSPDYRYADERNRTGTITDIIKIGRQVKIILNIIFGKFFGPTVTLIEGWIFGAGPSVSDFNRPSYKTACDIHLKHVFLA